VAFFGSKTLNFGKYKIVFISSSIVSIKHLKYVFVLEFIFNDLY